MSKFKDIPRYKGRYSVSAEGVVKRNEWEIVQVSKRGKTYVRTFKEKIMTPVVDTSGYLTVKLTSEEGAKTERVHKLVAETYLDKVEGKEEVNHIDHNKTNNRVSNLEYVTRQENMDKYFEFIGIKKEDNLCVKCGTKIAKTSNKCVKCTNADRQNLYEKMGKGKRELQREISETLNFEKVGRRYGVTGNAVRKWCNKFGLPTSIKEYSN